jgi:hypothetical protein
MTKIRIAVTSIALSAPLWLPALAEASYGKGGRPRQARRGRMNHEGRRVNVAQHDLTRLLRAVAAWLESHPEAKVDSIHLDPLVKQYKVCCYGVAGKADLAARARAIGGHWTKHADSESGLFRLMQEIAPGVFYELIASQSSVCERVHVGVKLVTEVAPDAPTVERTVPVYEWRCGSILEATP